VRVAYESDREGLRIMQLHKDSRRARSGAVRRRCRCQRP
jgi:hypothetical protein